VANKFSNCAVLVTMALLSQIDAYAQEPAQRESIDKIWHGEYEVEADGRVIETITHRYQILQRDKLEDLKFYSISYSTSIQTGEVLEAYTLKRDGRQIKVPDGNYQTQVNNGNGASGPAISDRTRLSVIFPDLETGDSVHIRYKVVERAPIFPGQASFAVGFSLFDVTEDARITVRYPKSLPLKSEAHHLVVRPTKDLGGHQVLEWQYSNKDPRQFTDKDRGIWKTSESPGVLLSTFPSYEAIAAAYGQRALPKAVPTAKMRELARRIVGSESDRKAKARAIYEWVSQNLTYGGNCIGVGAVVPRDVEVVVENKMGDCKDHATVMQALLAAVDIASEQVLINAGGQYDLPDTPVVSLVNHVMNFLPDWKIYLDATAKDVPFGYLPNQAYGKPVIHVRAKDVLAKIPDPPADAHEQKLFMGIRLAPNGSATGTMRVTLKGTAAAGARAYMRALTPDGEREFVRRAFASQGVKGSGVLKRNDTNGLSENYEYEVDFSIDNYLRGGPNGAFYFAPVLGTAMPVMRFADIDDRPESTRDTPCVGFKTSEMLEYSIPPTIRLISTPDDLDVQESMVSYSARYEKTADGVRVKRSLHDKTTQAICTPNVMQLLVKQAGPVAENLRTQVLYKRQSP
jgi:transglutaminase-like putative cysteine protease